MTGNIVSFDIGSAQIKLVWCAGGVCKAAVSAPVPDGLVRGGTIVSMDAMADLLRQLAKENNLPRSAQAAVILPAPLVFTRITELPPMTEGQLTYNLPFEFKDYLTQEKIRYYFDYAVQELVRGEDDSVTRMKLFACATLKTTIEDYRSMMNRAGFKLKLALPEDQVDRAEEITREFARRLPQVQKLLLEDLDATFESDPAAASREEIIFAYPGLFAIFVYRIAHLLYCQRVPMIPRIMSEYAHSRTGIDIHPGASIGPHFFIDHGTGIVVGETTVIGRNVKLYQGVTLGAMSPRAGHASLPGKRHPTVGDDVTIYSGASILGGDTDIGDGSVVGGNVFLTRSVRSGTRVAAATPAPVLKNPGDPFVYTI